jgi:alpha-1,2-mannosyltransferase
MYAVTLSSALFLLEKYSSAVSVAAAGVILGWPFSILVFLPITVYSLMRGPFKRVFLSGFLTSLSLLVSNTFTLSVMLRSEQVHI